MTRRASPSRFPVAHAWRKGPGRRRKLALVLAAHNEELFLEQTILSAIIAGQRPRDIFVVDDGSKDRTRAIALALLGADNVLSQWQHGKSRALEHIVAAKHLTKRYEWVHFADSDTLFDVKYFTVLRRALNPEYAAMTGYIASLPGTATSEYRIYEYTWGMEVIRRFQNALNLIIVIPGPSSCFRSDVLDQIQFTSGTITEDFDWTLQIHRHRLGRIRFVPKAKVYTQDPGTLKDYTRQITRWYRGIFQVARLRGLGRHARKEDMYFLYQISQILSSVALLFVIGPASVMLYGSYVWLATIFLLDVAQFGLSVLLAGSLARRADIVAHLPHFYMMRWWSCFVFLREMVAVGLLGRHMHGTKAYWSTTGRRYAI